MTGDKMLRIRPKIMVLTICLILATIPMALCATPHATGNHKVITEADNGNTIYIKEGQTFIINLNENPSTGYSWELSLSKGLGLLSDKYYSPESSKKDGGLVLGAAGFHSWEIKAMDKGNQEVNGVYKRSWEPETGEEQTFKLNVVVV
jgi:inhibitor of cysteine peptidase